MKINSIFTSINGEVSGLGQGSIATLIRLQGCNLRCSYCDTKYAQFKEAGIDMSEEEIIKEVKRLKIKNITITGGEPLNQEDDLYELVKKLNINQDCQISIETNGSQEIPHWGGYVKSWVADWKTPSSKMSHKMHFYNFDDLGQKDYVKFVIKDICDYKYAIDIMKKFNKEGGGVPRFAFSPIFSGKVPGINTAILIEWMKTDKTCIKNNVILNLQLHKIIKVA